jgi:hypothetical protein
MIRIAFLPGAPRSTRDALKWTACWPPRHDVHRPGIMLTVFGAHFSYSFLSWVTLFGDILALNRLIAPGLAVLFGLALPALTRTASAPRSAWWRSIPRPRGWWRSTSP